MSHANALLTPRGRLALARCVVEDGWPLRRAAERFQVSPTTAARWSARYREAATAGMVDRSSRPNHSPDAPRDARNVASSGCGSPAGGTGPHRLAPRGAWPG